MQQFIEILERKKLRRRVLGLLGTYGWSGGGVKTLTRFAENGDWDPVDPVVEAKCSPTADDLARCRELEQNFARRLGEVQE